MEQYEKHVFPVQNESDEEEMYLLYPNKVKDGYSIDDYEKTFQYALNKINFTATDTRKVLNALCTIALHLDSEDVKKFYRDKEKSSKNPILQSRINYIMSCYEEDLYMEYQARQYEESVSND